MQTQKYMKVLSHKWEINFSSEMDKGTECQKWGKYNFNMITIENSSEYLLNGHKTHIWK